jgi:hypothetical protein
MQTAAGGRSVHRRATQERCHRLQRPAETHALQSDGVDGFATFPLAEAEKAQRQGRSQADHAQNRRPYAESLAVAVCAMS